MDLRYSTDPEGIKRMNTDELRSAYLIENLFGHDSVQMVYSDIERSIVGSAVPAARSLKLEAAKSEMSADYFLERREIGIINIGDEGVVEANGKKYMLKNRDALYIGKGVELVEFKNTGSKSLPKFYFVSYPAHKDFPVTHINFEKADRTELGSRESANRRVINKLIHEKTVNTCQIVMGITELEEGSVWNTMPPHTHTRRSEIYMYFNVKNDSLVLHLMGNPKETRHIIVRNEQVVLSPSWSMHSGVGTTGYSFIWTMGGENKEFDDMDGVKTTDIK
jgi:4-deoxy-L-threo-5-hexosulose-uronate ketol-isomerase